MASDADASITSSSLLRLVRDREGLAGVERPDGSVLTLLQVLAVGRNYSEHAAEQGLKAPERPMIFTKSPSSIIFDGEPIVIPSMCADAETGGPEQVDFEAELAVILGAPALNVPVANALDCVLGYCCANDVSARWWQKHGSGGQFCRGKSLDSFCPLGPHVVLASSISPDDLAISCRVGAVEQGASSSGMDLMQNDRTSSMLFSVAELIAELSRAWTLLPGTVILTGTPSGVGMARTPPRYLRPGEWVEVEIEGLGALRNPVMLGGG